MKALAPTTRAQVAQIARQTIKPMMETKYRADDLVGDSGYPLQIYGSVAPSGTGATVQLFNALPTLAIGDNGFQRDGQKVLPVKHTMELDFTFNNQIQDVSKTGNLDSCAWDVTVHVWYGYAKRYKNWFDIQTNAAALTGEMFELGNGNSGQFGGAPYDILRKVNSDVLTVKRKSFRMFRPFGAQNQATLQGGLTTYFPQLIKKHITLKFGKRSSLLYDEGGSYPENYAPFVIIGYEHNDGTQAANALYNAGSPSILNTPAIQVQGIRKLWYKDA